MLANGGWDLIQRLKRLKSKKIRDFMFSQSYCRESPKTLSRVFSVTVTDISKPCSYFVFRNVENCNAIDTAYIPKERNLKK